MPTGVALVLGVCGLRAPWGLAPSGVLSPMPCARGGVAGRVELACAGGPAALAGYWRGGRLFDLLLQQVAAVCPVLLQNVVCRQSGPGYGRRMGGPGVARRGGCTAHGERSALRSSRRLCAVCLRYTVTLEYGY